MDPPFVVGKVVRPPYFIDRESEMNRLVHSLGSGSENQLVIGLRRMGKSSLLWNMTEAISRDYPGTLTAYLDCRRVTSVHGFGDQLITAVLEAYQSRHAAAGWLKLKARLLTDNLSQIVPEIGKVGGSVGETFGAYVELREKSIDERRFLTRAFDFLDRFSHEHDERYVIVLDEFQELDKLQEPLVFQLFKSYSDRLEKVRFAFSGSTMSVLQAIFLRQDSPLYLMAGKTPLDVLPEDVVIRFLHERMGVAGVDMEQKAAKLVAVLTGGIPFYVQKLGLNCWLQCLQRRSKNVTLADVNRAFEDMIGEMSAEFETRFEHKFGAAQKAILIELSQGQSLRRADLARQTRRPSEQLSSSLTALEGAMEIEKPERGKYRISDPVFGAWIRKRVAGSA